jgi:phycoerythrin-associated linker protein
MVPYNRSSQSEVGRSQVTYNRTFAVDRGPAQINSAVTASQLVYAVASNAANKIAPARISLGGSGEANKKTFKIVVQGSKFDGPRRLSNTTYLVAGDNITPQLQRIHRTSGKVVSITEVV